MTPFLTLIISDYKQRTRSYAFLITACISLAIAYTFVPEPNANYSTIRISNYVGYYNAAWFGYVTAIMTSIFLSLIGFYLVNSGIKKDRNTKVGQVVAATPISNLKYLLAKTLTNFSVLLTIVAIVFVMSLLLFWWYNDGYPFQLLQFVKPYAYITLPAMFFVSVVAVLSEILLGRYSVLQNLGFFAIFSVLMIFSPQNESEYALDVFGSKIVMHTLEEQVRAITQSPESKDLTIGYVLGNTKKPQKFEFNGIHFSPLFLSSRFLIFILGVLAIVLIAPFFNRFEYHSIKQPKKTRSKIETTNPQQEISLSTIPKAQVNYSIAGLIRTESKLLFRTGKSWMWMFSVLGMILLGTLPLEMAHQMVLPLLWFLQVHRLAQLTSKEIPSNIHYFTFNAYKPLRRVLSSQLLTGILLLLLLASPLLIRFGIAMQGTAITTVVLGTLFIVFLAGLLGILSQGRKLFEVLFFMITYANINGIPYLDYFGGLSTEGMYIVNLLIATIVLGIASFTIRYFQLRKS